MKESDEGKEFYSPFPSMNSLLKIPSGIIQLFEL